MKKILIFATALLTLCACTPKADYSFDGTISEEVLDNYLSHAMTISEFLTPVSLLNEGAYPDKQADIDLILNTGTKFVGRAIYRWGGEAVLNDPTFWEEARATAAAVHEKDPDVIFQAAVFEAIYKKGIDQVRIPAWVFEAFDLPVEDRCFRYDDMIFPEGIGVDLWAKDGSVPDIRQRETQMWFLYLITSYVEIGCEAIHFGQTYWIGHEDREKWDVFNEFLTKVREFAGARARRHIVLFDAHAYAGGMMHGDRSLLDFISFPLRAKGDTTEFLGAVMEVGWKDAVYCKTGAAITPSGWATQHMPYLVEFDNYGVSDHPGKCNNPGELWGYDEISWFYSLGEGRREEFLEYAYNWIRTTDPAGHLQMPGRRGVTLSKNPSVFFMARAVAKSEEVPYGMGLEATIKKLWEK